jgi:sec-independent protein translocase protein TatC
MWWMSHLTALRVRLVRTLVVFGILLIASLVFVSKIFHYLTSPLKSMHVHLIATSPGEIVLVYMTLGAAVAIGLTIPYAMYEVWAFVSPGLTSFERRLAMSMLPGIVLTFIAGVVFAWFVTFPLVVHFLIRLTESQGLLVLLQANSYFSFLALICLPFGLACELPVVVFALARIGLVTAKAMRRVRKYAYLIIVIIGVLISPPELISHLSVTVPMMLIYEGSIGLAWVAEKRRKAHRSADDAANHLS